ncbi:MAG: polyprenyl synthetase family protein [Deltaproteobacteria bacterium]|nr:polyprenyl synthetase family protein [Deltaproteobacteria bacterium]
MQEAFDLIKVELEQVDLEFKKNLDSQVYLVRKVGEYILSSGGKRFRPSLLLLSARLCGYDGREHIPLAAVVEFIHTATLLHDDVVDNAKLRRGSTSANALWGNEASILVGDYLFSRSFHTMVKSGSMDVLRVLSWTTTLMAEGEILQLLKNSDVETTEEEYLDVVKNKTAVLISAACQVGGILAAVSKEREEALAVYGMNLGIAFQLMDDCLDYISNDEDLGKAVGNDLKEGKVTLPLIHALENSSPVEQEMVREVIEGDEISDEQLTSVTDLIKRHDGIAYTIDSARRYVSDAGKQLEIFEPNIERAALAAVADYVVERSY